MTTWPQPGAPGAAITGSPYPPPCLLPNPQKLKHFDRQHPCFGAQVGAHSLAQGAGAHGAGIGAGAGAAHGAWAQVGAQVGAHAGLQQSFGQWIVGRQIFGQ